MVYELTHNHQRFLLFPRHRILHAVVEGSIRNVTVISEDMMYTLLNRYEWVLK